MRAALVGVVAAMLTVVGCGKNSSPVEPSGQPRWVPSPLEGVWTGTVEESYGGRGRLTVSLTERLFNQFFGSFEIEFEDSSRNRSGRVSTSAMFLEVPGHPGVFPGFTLVAEHGLVCEDGSWPNHALAYVGLDGDRLTGTYTWESCLETIEGAFELKRAAKPSGF